MDLVELLEDVAVEPSWRVHKEAPASLSTGMQGMVVHRRPQDPPLYDVEFVDSASQDALVLATLRASQIRVVERDTLGTP
ncbi:MAG: hypothetical protein OJF49_004393 [Ktedonobacterales bacterium]|nr:MAG: hypothetical protein OJF49_004393 [Ktedonobacterales bacterium]